LTYRIGTNKVTTLILKTMLRCNLSFDLMTSQVGRFFFAQMTNEHYPILPFFASWLWPMVKKWRPFQNR